MSLGQKIIEKLHLMQQMEDQMHFSVRSADGSEKGYQISEKEAGIRVSLLIPDFDKYSFVISKIELENDKAPAEQGILDTLRKQAKFIEQKITYLPETFSLIELDEKMQVAQIRSNKPLHVNDASQYFEILLQQGKGLKLMRYEKQKDQPERQSIHFMLTEEIFPRLIDDLASTLKKQV